VSYVAALAAWSLLHLAWQGGALLAAWLVARRVVRRRAPAVRYRVAASLLALAAAAPALTAAATHVALLRGAAAAGATGGAAAPLVAPAGEAAVAALFDAWYPALRWPLAAWALGALLLGLRLAGGVRRLRALRAGGPSGTRAQHVAERRLAVLAARLGVSPAPALRWSTAVAAPMVVGARRPTIVVPASLAAALAPDELDAVLLHELAHVRRRDAAANLAQCVVEAALWVHPAVWLLSDAVRAEREHCCDREAVRVSGAPVALARALVRLHEAAATATPALAVAWGGGELTRRVEELVLARPAAGALGRGRRGAAGRALLGVCAAAASVAVVGAPAALARDSEALVVAGAAARAVPGRVTTFEARDPAGPFTLRLVNGRVSSLRIAGARVPARRLRQVRDSVRVLGPAGDRVLLSVYVNPAAGRIGWRPRSAAR
jgi:beta-lactamase regulating signal transducer with metallopeptidase domain